MSKLLLILKCKMREKVVAGNIYHVLSRGVDKRVIFLDTEDRYRFLHDLFEFNNTEPTGNLTYHFRAHPKDIVSPKMPKNAKPRKLLIELLAFCIMPNHYHLLIKPRFDDGLTRFMKKLNIGYAKYFNEKYKRTGTLFEGRFKSVAVTSEAHFIHIPYYIHLNPLDLKFPEWRERQIKSPQRALEFLQSYRWSSHLDYLGTKNFPSLTQREFLNKFFEGPAGYKEKITQWVQTIHVGELGAAALE